jgi:Zn-dependent M28 family amino/carboxypeptidase
MEESFALGPFPPPEKLPRTDADADEGFGKWSSPAAALDAESEGFKNLDEAITSAVKAVDEASITDLLKGLLHFPTRHTLSPHNVEAAEWLRGQFSSFGYADVSLHDFKIAGLTRHNVVCMKPGGAEPGRLVVVCAHYDSRMKTLADSASAAPGAVDNGSGVAVLLEAARVLEGADTNCSVRFVAFSGEEQGLAGADAYAEAVRAAGTDIVLLINLDMVGHPVDAEKRTIVIERDEGNATTANDAASGTFAAAMAQAAAAYTSLKVKAGKIYDSDYMPFEQRGYVCVGAFDGSTVAPFYHSVNDTLDKVDTGFCAEVARMVVATVLKVAGLT